MKKIPLKTLLLFFIVTSLIMISFVLWEADIQSCMKKAIEFADSNLLLVSFILFLTLASDIFLPIPSVLAGGMCGLMLGVIPGFLTAFLAMTASSAVGYLIGKKSKHLANRLLGDEEMTILSDIHKRGGPFLLLGLRPVPILSETSTIFAGLSGVPVKKAAFYISIGNAVVSAVYVFTGAYFRSSEEFTIPLFITCFVLSGVFMLIPLAIKKFK